MNGWHGASYVFSPSSYCFLEKAMAPNSSTLAWKIPWTEEPGRLQSMGVTEGRTQLSNFTFTFHFHALEKEMTTYSSVLAWRIPGMGEPGGLQSMGSHRVRHDWSDLAAVAATASRYNSLLGDVELWCLYGFKAGPADILFGTKLQVWEMLSLTRWTSLNAYN